MTPLRTKMMHQLQLHRLAHHTQKAYVRAVEDVARFYWRSPDQLTADEIRNYLHHLLVERHLAWSTCNIVAAGLRFFYLETLGWDALKLNLPPRKGQHLLPRVFSVDPRAHLNRKLRLRELGWMIGRLVDKEITAEKSIGCEKISKKYDHT